MLPPVSLPVDGGDLDGYCTQTWRHGVSLYPCQDGYLAGWLSAAATAESDGVGRAFDLTNLHNHIPGGLPQQRLSCTGMRLRQRKLRCGERKGRYLKGLVGKARHFFSAGVWGANRLPPPPPARWRDAEAEKSLLLLSVLVAVKRHWREVQSDLRP